VVLALLRKRPMDWKAGKKALESQFGTERKQRTRLEADRCTLLMGALEAAQKKDTQRVQQVLDKHPEDALYQHVRGKRPPHFHSRAPPPVHRLRRL